MKDTATMNSDVSSSKIGSVSNYSIENDQIIAETIEYPIFASKQYSAAVTSLNNEYEQRARNYHQHVVTEMYPEAVRQYYDSLRNQFPVRSYDVMMIYQITYYDDGIVSLYSDDYQYTGGAHGNTIRSSDTWNLQTGTKVMLRDLFPPGFDYTAYITDQIASQAAEQVRMGTNQYFDDVNNLIKQNFNEESFYLTPGGIVIYFQQYDIAPYSSGFPEFLIAPVQM